MFCACAPNIISSLPSSEYGPTSSLHSCAATASHLAVAFCTSRTCRIADQDNTPASGRSATSPSGSPGESTEAWPLRERVALAVAGEERAEVAVKNSGSLHQAFVEFL
ncbi:Os05g0527867 [Oryza sativa Japonica Group]|uniref:Os05g0527867 protein n=1 Tax=Oryza sativa subsp. japonica TaxID=39947 RepID=A0A0P0WQ11_ORYSJ|nr:Os05g0527867 [Oryza sativa Japonica Group]